MVIRNEKVEKALNDEIDFLKLQKMFEKETDERFI